MAARQKESQRLTALGVIGHETAPTKGRAKEERRPAFLDGRKLANRERTVAMALRFTVEERQLMERLAIETGRSFTDLSREGLQLVAEREAKKAKT